MGKTLARKLFFLSALLATVVLVGTLGYRELDGWSWFDSLYMTVITLATIGYGETHPLSDQGRVFTIALIIFGTGVVGYGVSSLTLLLFQGDLPLYLKRRKMEKNIARLGNHVVICGLSRTGWYALEELLRNHKQVVVIEKNEANVAQLEEREIPYIVGDATDDENLLAAGILKANSLVSCLTSDADNAFVVVTAKSLNPGINAVSKAETENAKRKLKAVGADHVVIPSHLGGFNLASLIVHPENQHFFEQLHLRFPKTFRAEILAIPADWNNLSIENALPLAHGNMIAIALEQPGGDVLFNPSPDTVLHQGGSLLVIGKVGQPSG